MKKESGTTATTITTIAQRYTTIVSSGVESVSESELTIFQYHLESRFLNFLELISCLPGLENKLPLRPSVARIIASNKPKNQGRGEGLKIESEPKSQSSKIENVTIVTIVH